ncbi:MAG: hypothetical protein C0424_08940 [Sphingobacteriaceae bacterium]|nr:hypothetical protein [Sphingobacteriaceae bacterium]
MRYFYLILWCALSLVLCSSCLRTYVCSCETVITDTSSGMLKSNTQFGISIESYDRKEAMNACQAANLTTIFDDETTVTFCKLK